MLFNYRKGRGKNGPKELLDGYRGYLQCDGYPVYNKIAEKAKDIILAGCLVHARRKFHEALDNDRNQAEKALAIFRDIYKEEKKIKDKANGDLQKIKNLRIKEIQPLLIQIKQWIIEEQYKVLPKSKIGSAMTYFINQYHKFENILKDGRIELDNNKIENSIMWLSVEKIISSVDRIKQLKMQLCYIHSLEVARCKTSTQENGWQTP